MVLIIWVCLIDRCYDSLNYRAIFDLLLTVSNSYKISICISCGSTDVLPTLCSLYWYLLWAWLRGRSYISNLRSCRARCIDILNIYIRRRIFGFNLKNSLFIKWSFCSLHTHNIDRFCKERIIDTLDKVKLLLDYIESERYRSITNNRGCCNDWNRCKTSNSWQTCG